MAARPTAHRGNRDEPCAAYRSGETGASWLAARPTAHRGNRDEPCAAYRSGETGASWRAEWVGSTCACAAGCLVGTQPNASRQLRACAPAGRMRHSCFEQAPTSECVAVHIHTLGDRWKAPQARCRIPQANATGLPTRALHAPAVGLGLCWHASSIVVGNLQSLRVGSRECHLALMCRGNHLPQERS